MHFGVRFVSCIRYVFFFVVIYFFRIADWKSHSYKFINKSCSIFSVLSEPFCWIYIFFLFLQFQLSFKCSGSSHSPPSTLDSHVDPHTGVQLQEVTATISKDLVFEYFGKSPFKCDCHAWSPRGKAKSQSATIEVACKWSSCCFFSSLYWIYVHAIFGSSSDHLQCGGSFSVKMVRCVCTWNHLRSWAFVWHVFGLTLICKMRTKYAQSEYAKIEHSAIYVRINCQTSTATKMPHAVYHF